MSQNRRQKNHHTDHSPQHFSQFAKCLLSQISFTHICLKTPSRSLFHDLSPQSHNLVLFVPHPTRNNCTWTVRLFFSLWERKSFAWIIPIYLHYLSEPILIEITILLDRAGDWGGWRLEEEDGCWRWESCCVDGGIGFKWQVTNDRWFCGSCFSWRLAIKVLHLSSYQYCLLLQNNNIIFYLITNKHR